MKRTAIRPMSSRRRALNVRRRKAEQALYDAAPWCAMCGKTGTELHGHERLGRAQGGDQANPDVLLCDRCNSWCEDNPRAAALAGWKVSRKWQPSDGAA